MGQLEGKLALVTGASRGIGYHSAIALAKEGAHVIAVAKTVGGLEELDDEIQSFGGQSTLVPHDLLDYDGIDRLGGTIFERWQSLDILVANAGMLGGLSPVEHVEPKTFEKVNALNVTANWRLIRSMSPLLRNSKDGRAVFMISELADEARPFWSTYASSQAALKSLVMTWAKETESSGLKVNLLDPGPTNTALRAQAMPGEDKENLSQPHDIGASLLPLVSPSMSETGKVFNRL